MRSGGSASSWRHWPGDGGVQVRSDDGFRDFYATEFPRLAAYCRALVGDEELARDVAQESLVRVFTRWISVREPRAYAYLVAVNLSRRQGRRGALERRALDRIGSPPDTAPDASVGADGAWLRDLVDGLPERLRMPVLLHYYADLPVNDVARLLRRPVGTVKQRLHEARSLLRTAGGTDDG